MVIVANDTWAAFLFLGAGGVMLLSAGIGLLVWCRYEPDEPMPAELGSAPRLMATAPRDDRGIRRLGGPPPRQKPLRAAGRRAVSVGEGVGLERQKPTRTASDSRRARFGAPAAEEGEGVVLLSKDDDVPRDPEQERRVAVLESLQALEEAQEEARHKRVELTTQIEHERFWGPEATPRLIEEPVPLAI